MPFSNTAFGPDYEVTFNSGLRACFAGAGECGMSGPIRGRLEIDGYGVIESALRPFYADPLENQRFMGYQQLEMTNAPRVLIHVVDRVNNEERVVPVPFGAYVFQKITHDEFLLLDEYRSVTTVHRLEPAFKRNV